MDVTISDYTFHFLFENGGDIFE